MIESLVSVIIPCFNHANLLPRAVESVLRQKYLHEIIIVDDCSKDSSLDVAEQLCSLDPRIAVFKTSKNSGPAAARNFGALYATGHYVSFLDSDDEYLPNFLADTVSHLESSTEMKAIKSWVEFLDQDGKPIFENDDPRQEALVFSLPNNVLLTKESFDLLGGFPESAAFRTKFAGEDVAFNQAIAKYLSPLGRLEEVGYRYWCKPGDHLDRFYKNTVLTDSGFDFIHLDDEQLPGGLLERAISIYMDEVALRVKSSDI